MGRRRIQEWEKSARNLRAVNQKPLYIMLRSVMWKIDGKDAQGKIFSKQIRVDVPMKERDKTPHSLFHFLLVEKFK